MYLILEYRTPAVPATTLVELCTRKIQNTQSWFKYDLTLLPKELKESVEQPQKEWESVWKEKSIANFAAELIDPEDEEANPWCAASIWIERCNCLFAVLSDDWYRVEIPRLPHYDGIPEDASCLLKQRASNWYIIKRSSCDF